MSKVYISGPMSGYPNFNKEAFNTAARIWEEKGHTVFNPGIQAGEGYADCLPQDMRWVEECDIVAVLPGWYRSKGALLEVIYAKLLGKKLVFADTGEPLYELEVQADTFRLVLSPV